MIEVDDLFNLFSPEDNNYSNTYVDFTTQPVYKLGMYRKLILNHINFKKKVIYFFKKSNAELSLEEMAEAGEFVAYNRAWHYIKDITLEDDDHVEAIVTHGNSALETAFELGIKFFQKTEEYEKCAHLLKLLKKSQEFSN